MGGQGTEKTRSGRRQKWIYRVRKMRVGLLNGDSKSSSVRYHATSWLPARSIVAECLAARQDIDPSGEIMVLTRFCPVDSRSKWDYFHNDSKSKSFAMM
ncbi:hypothetical protein I3760_01G049200 [Carya illinoinensis]|nr:hypothetical protein I3760_01G049200 [Carya illinoinensis]